MNKENINKNIIHYWTVITYIFAAIFGILKLEFQTANLIFCL